MPPSKQSPWMPVTVLAILFTLPVCVAAGSVDAMFVLNSLVLLLGAQISRTPR